MEEPEQAIEVLGQAVSLVNGRRAPRLLFGLNFNLIVNYCHLGRFEEAATLLPQVQELALVLGKELNLIRAVWLKGKIEVGLGRIEGARAAFEQVRGEFTYRTMAYDCALVTLELAALLLGMGLQGGYGSSPAKCFGFSDRRESIARRLQLSRSSATPSGATPPP